MIYYLWIIVRRTAAHVSLLQNYLTFSSFAYFVATSTAFYWESPGMCVASSNLSLAHLCPNTA